MSKKIKVFLIPALLLIFTIAVAFVAFFTSDYFYLVIAFIVDAIIALLFYPKMLASKHISLPEAKKPHLNLMTKSKNHLELKLNFKGIKLNIKNRFSLFYLTFVLVASLITAYFGIFRLKDAAPEAGFLQSYLDSLLVGVSENFIIFTAILVLLLSLHYFLVKKEKKITKLFYSAGLTLTFALLTLIFAPIFVFGFSIVDVSNLKRQIKTNPHSVGVFVETEKIVEMLRNFDNPPNIVGKDTNVESVVVSLKTQNRGHFYKNRVVPTTSSLSPYKLDLSSNTVLLVDNNLIITEIDKEKIEAVSPIVGKLFVKETLAPRYIKDEPNVNIMGRQEYLKYRDEQINEAVQKIEGYIVEIQDEINAVYGNIATAKNEIASYESWLATASSNRDAEYNSCVNETCYTYSYSYYSGFYSIPYRCNSDAYCNSIRQSWDNAIADNQSGLQEWRNYLSSQQRYLTELQDLELLYKDYLSLVESQKEQTPYELGLFEPEKTVKVVLENTDTASLGDFYATLVHEYLHYTSYVSEERLLDGFFEEGLTEYFARKTIKNNLNVETNIGYPLITSIIFEMVKKVQEERLEEIYFNKDQNALVELLNQTYGDNFYEDSQLYFTIIYYAPPKEALKVANNIIFKIGGEELTEEDLISSYSELN